MTTSHRPQLEARNGAKNIEYIPTSTQHARLLPGHKEVKYRNTKKRVLNRKVESTPSEEAKKRIKITGAEECSKDEEIQATDSSDEYEEEEEESEDEEALLEEWNKVKQERLDKKLREQRAEITAAQNEEVTKPQKLGGWRSNTVFGRKGTVNQSVSISENNSNGKGKYVNNITQSEYHKEFIRKHVK